MANPQPNEFTRISNELYSAIIQTDFSKRQRNILDLVIRMSYGCGKKTAILRPVDFELVGVYKTHVSKELDYLVKSKVLFINGHEITINKNYEEWRVSLVRGADEEKFKQVLHRNLSYQNSNLPLREVTKTVTDGYQNSNFEVTKTVTECDPQPSNDAGCEAPKERIKEIFKESTVTPPLPPSKKNESLDAILKRFPRYSNEQLTLIREYWDLMRFTRRTGKVAASIIVKAMEYWERFEINIVLEALKIHITKYQSKREEYTFGIMRRLMNEQKLKPKGGTINEQRGSPSGKDEFDSIDFSKFTYQGTG